MQIKVTHHAIKQYRRKMFDFDISDQEAGKILSAIAKNGTRICSRPAIQYPVYEIKYQKLSIAAEVSKDMITVITFLGDTRYQSWVRSKEIALRYAWGKAGKEKCYTKLTLSEALSQVQQQDQILQG